MTDANDEPLGATVKPGIRFRLSSLLLVPLFLSPLFLSLLFVSDELAGRPPRMGLTVFAYAAFFSLVFIINWYAHANRRSVKIKSLVFSSLTKGAVFGGIFGLQLWLPVMTVFAVRSWPRNAPVLSFWEIIQFADPELLIAFALFVLTDVVIGTATGGLFGLCVSRAKGHRPIEHPRSP